ncbi:MAG: hypothetical protein PW788_08095 [Micavibrio sp.]|nr:hypothetical protein [Micavibrio sp.]
MAKATRAKLSASLIVLIIGVILCRFSAKGPSMGVDNARMFAVLLATIAPFAQSPSIYTFAFSCKVCLIICCFATIVTGASAHSEPEAFFTFMFIAFGYFILSAALWSILKLVQGAIILAKAAKAAQDKNNETR